MDEEKTTQEKSEETKESPDEGVQSKTISELDRADQIAERLKRENDRTEELLIRNEALEARRTIGGTSGSAPPAEKKEEVSPKEYAEKALSGELNVKKE